MLKSHGLRLLPLVVLSGCAAPYERPDAQPWNDAPIKAGDWRNVSCDVVIQTFHDECLRQHKVIGIEPNETYSSRFPGKDASSTAEAAKSSDIVAAAPPPQPVGLDAAAAEQQAHAMMEGKLKDPYSAHWTCGSAQWGTLGSGKAWGGTNYTGWILPCEINAKNSYGAYAGATRYAFLFIDNHLRRAVELGAEGPFATQRVIYDN